MTYKLSVIIPHYNTPDMLWKLVNSIPDREDIQIIVVDDNSTDNKEKLKEVIEKCTDKIEFYVNDTGVQSAGACRNIGIKHVKGKWMLFADADDFFMPDMYKILSDYMDSDFEQVIFNVTSIYSDTDEIASRHVMHSQRIEKYLSKPSYENLLLVKRRVQPWAKLYRSEVIKKNNILFSEVLHHNDMFYSVKAAFYTTKVAVDNRVLYCITKTKGSLTNIMSLKSYKLHIEEYIKSFLFCKEHYSKTDMKILNYNAANLLHEGLKRNINKKEIIRACARMVRIGIPIITLKCLDYHVLKLHFDIDKEVYGKKGRAYQVKK